MNVLMQILHWQKYYFKELITMTKQEWNDKLDTAMTKNYDLSMEIANLNLKIDSLQEKMFVSGSESEIDEVKKKKLSGL